MLAQRPFHEQLQMLEVEVLALGGMAERALSAAVTSLRDRQDAGSQQVIDGDDELDRLYLLVEEHALQLLALQNPVAVDLRLISAVLHVNFHLERVGDMAVNIAKIGKATRRLPSEPRVAANLDQMCDIVRSMISTSIEAFAKRDLLLAQRLPEMDDPVDQLNRAMYRQVTSHASDPSLLEWGVRMMIVSRQLERAGDHAVDVGEQVAFLLTGEFREFTDASHAIGEAPDVD